MPKSDLSCTQKKKGKTNKKAKKNQDKRLQNRERQINNAHWDTDNYLHLVSIHFLICTEKTEHLGEDCGLEAYNQNAGLIGVFDGCGGLGAGICPAADNKTEAYLASRAIGNATYLWFVHGCTGMNFDLKLLKQIILSCLNHCKKYSNRSHSVIKGSLFKSYPSTMATIVSFVCNKQMMTQHIWAGDSRTYLLDNDGLGQVSTDDIQSGDAMTNLTNDGALTNVISSDASFELHSKALPISRPTVLLAATDGCFGYVSSPMEFEFILLSTLFDSRNTAEWQKNLKDKLDSISGDDQTIAIEAIGFDTFTEMQDYYSERYAYIQRIQKTLEGSANDSITISTWDTYKTNYYRYAD